MIQDLGTLSTVPLFATLDDHGLHRLAARSTVRTVNAGDVVAVQDEPCTHLIVVEFGGLTSVYDTIDGQKRRLGEFTAPCAVDKVATLDGEGHAATWLAVTRSRLRMIRCEALLAAIEEVPAARRHVLRYLARQLRVSRVSVNRALQQLAREGLVRIEPGVIVVLAPDLQARRAWRNYQSTSGGM